MNDRLSHPGVARRRALAGLAGWAVAGLLPASARAAQTGAAPAVLSRPALMSPKALGAAMLAVTRAGSRLVAVGERGTVLLSDDHGQHWRQAAVPVQVTLTCVTFADERHGWAAGHLGTILHSDDGGQTWRKQLDGITAAARMAEAARGSGDFSRTVPRLSGRRTQVCTETPWPYSTIRPRWLLRPGMMWNWMSGRSSPGGV